MTESDFRELIAERDRLIEELILTCIKHQGKDFNLLHEGGLKLAAKDVADPFAAEYLADLRATAEEFHALDSKDFDAYLGLKGRRENLANDLKQFASNIRAELLRNRSKFVYKFKP